MFIDEYMKELSSKGISEELLMGVGNFDIEAINELYKKHGFDVDKISKKAMSQKLANLLVFEIDSKFFYDIDVTFACTYELDKTLFDAIFKKDEEVSSFFFVTGVENALSIDFERGDYSYLLQNLTDNWHKINPIAQKIIKGMIRNEIEYEKLTEATAKKWNSFLDQLGVSRKPTPFTEG